MRKFILLLVFVGSFGTLLNAIDDNRTKIAQKQVEAQMEREKKYAKEQIFYQGSDYNLSVAEVDKKSLSRVPTIEPDFDFDMDNVYSDIQ
jgi:hypothetical protein